MTTDTVRKVGLVKQVLKGIDDADDEKLQQVLESLDMLTVNDDGSRKRAATLRR